jgi:hypothetical protein
MKARWLWLLTLIVPVVGGLLAVVVYSDTFGGALILIGWPLTTLLAGIAMWSSISAAHWVAKTLAALVAALAVSMVVAPLLFLTSYVLSVVFFGDDDRTYF